MRYAFGHRDETAAKGRAARALMRNKCSPEAVATVVASELRRAYYKNHHRGGGVGAGHGVSRGGADGGDDEWVTDIYPGAVFKRDSG